MANSDNLIPFKKGESGNPNGRPRKSFAVINNQLREKGIEALSKTDLVEAYSLIFNSTEKDLKILAKDEETPYALRLIIGELNGNANARARAIADYRDYMFGKAKDNVDHTTNGKDINIINLGTGIKPKEE